MKKNIFKYHEEVRVGCMALFYYFQWKKVTEQLRIRHFITSVGFGISHVGRNLALNHAGVQTWYYTDSINSGLVTKGENLKGLHPYWTYLIYDHFITWSYSLVQYFHKDHPDSFKQCHVTGCLWNGYIVTKKEAIAKLEYDGLKDLDNFFVLGVFDTGYSLKSLVDYNQGIAFAEHILKLADTFPDIFVLFKEKMNREYHSFLDGKLGPELVDLYKKMGSHPRTTFFLHEGETSKIMSVCDMIISSPFSSPTFEFLSVNRPGIWHDSTGNHRDKPYAKLKGVVTHSYEELKIKFLEIKAMKPGEYQNPFPKNSPLMDPYRDGKAIDRFRDLLCANS